MNTFITSDLYLVAYLLSKNFPINKTSWNGNKVIFVFNDTPEIKKEVSNYILGKAIVEPQEFRDKIKIVKSMIYDLKGREHGDRSD